MTREELNAKNSPREYLLDDAAEVRRLMRECRGYLHTCHNKHGTDWEGRKFAIDALDKLSCAPDQPGHLSGCQLRGPGECQKEGKCMSEACVHYNKTECRPRMTVEAQVDGILYPEKTIPTSGLNDVNETTANYARRKELKP